MAVSSLEYLLFILELESDAPFAIRNVVLSDDAEARVTLQSTKYNNLVVNLHGAVFIACFRVVLGPSRLNLHLGPATAE